MANPPSPQSSFSPRRKWSIAFNVILSTVVVFLVLVGVNYISSQYFSKRFYLNSQARVELSSRTVSLLRGLTNHVDVTVYYDKDSPLYDDIISLLREYQSHTRNLAVKTVDYFRDPAAAQAFKAKYNIGSSTNKDFVVFDNGGNWTSVDGAWLSEYKFGFEQSTNANDSKVYVNRKRIAFNGEMLFSSKLFAVTQAKELKAYFLQGHGERSPNDQDQTDGYTKLAETFHRNFVKTDTLNNLFGTNAIPLDCNLLVIARPREKFQALELEKISQYLDQGGRLFALFDIYSTNTQLGLEAILAKWNVRVTHSVVLDRERAADPEQIGRAFSVTNFAAHDVVKSLWGTELEIILPRPIERIKAPSQAADEPQVTELAFSSPHSTLADNISSDPHSYPLMVAVERGAAKGVASERGGTRMLILGDSLFLNNYYIEGAANQDFADSAVNWLLDRTTLLEGISRQPVKEYRVIMNPHQTAAVKWILLGALPGGILLFGGLVWLRRRK